jgi:ribonuclease-3
MAAAEFLFERFPEKNEGFLTRVRAKIVNKKALTQYAGKVGLQHLIEMSEDMDRAGGRLNPSLLANAYEALIGAIYLDHGYAAARGFVLRTLQETFNLDELAHRRENFKSLLLEYAQARGWPQPQYQVLSEEGPGHRRVFAVEVLIGSEAHGRGRGRSKKSAEQSAARAALRSLESEGREDSDENGVALTG